MTLDHKTNSAITEGILEILNAGNEDIMRELLEAILNVTMKLERENALQAKPYERKEERKGYANGYKPKTLNTRTGALNLQIPQTRGFDFYPECLEKGCRSERALKLAIAEMYLKGVSTRKVEAITKALCGLEFTSMQVSRAAKELDDEFEKFRDRILGRFRYVFLDATYLKIRHNGSVIDQAILIAYGINESGRREILGTSAKLSEAELHWRDFLDSLIKRRLRGVELIISDDHAGLRKARRMLFNGVKWQRCQFHMIKNAQNYVPKKKLNTEIVEAMRDIFNSVTKSEATLRVKKIKDKFAKIAPEFVDWLEANIEEGLTCLSFPKSHRKRIRTTNGLERINREIKRRTRVAVLFPNTTSALRLVTGVLIEIHEEWITGVKYLNMKKKDESKCWYLEEVEAV